MQKFKIKTSPDGLELSGIVVEPDCRKMPLSGIFQIVHGMCEHKERYIPFMEFMASKGYVCVIHDHRGHGETVLEEGDLGYMYKGGWKALVEDIRLVNEWIKGKYPGHKCVMLGHSMGSMAARAFTKRYDDHIDELFVCGSPSRNPVVGLGKFLADTIAFFRGGRYHSPLLQKLSFGKFNEPFKDEGFSSAWVCSDMDTLVAYHNDPLCMFTFTANGFSNLYGLMRDCYSPKGWKMSKPGMPVHFISGSEDPCLISKKDFEKAVHAMKAVGYQDTDSKLFNGMRHEILNETDKAMVWDYVLERCLKDE